jgi:ferritin-like metal-binding protein YciE
MRHIGGYFSTEYIFLHWECIFSNTLPGGKIHNMKSSPTKPTRLKKLFVHELKDIFWAEKKLSDTGIPEMIGQANSGTLKKALQNHLEETNNQERRLDKVFQLIGMEPEATKCEALAGLRDEAKEITEDSEEGAMRDAGIITAAQKVEHYEIASYGFLKNFADSFGLSHVSYLLNETLEEEIEADRKLTEIALSEVNEEAMAEIDEEE